MNAALLCCLLFIFIFFFFFFVLRKDILTIENVKAEAEEEPCGGLEASVKLCLGTGARLTPGQVRQEEGLQQCQPQNTTYRKGPSLPVDAVSRPHGVSWPVPQSVPSPMVEGVPSLR